MSGATKGADHGVRNADIVSSGGEHSQSDLPDPVEEASPPTMRATSCGVNVKVASPTVSSTPRIEG
jgi:hypothetical protein